ncbi:MAG: hypothetical protein IJV82_05440 [Oscillospiraceae bacterium]|nr:hypothetical protein [Oscillospiraceae bacterium]
MKKSYSKPDIAFERFSLCTNIASGGCAKNVKTFADGNCGVNLGGRTVFLDGIAGCEQQGGYVVEDGSAMANYLCYHVPTATSALFNS